MPLGNERDLADRSTLRPLRPKRPKDRAAQILAAATRLFADRGFDGVGIDEIGEAVGIAGPSVYNHFESKDALLVAAAEGFMEGFPQRYESALRGLTAPDARLAALVAPTVHAMLDERHLFAAMTREARRLPPEAVEPVIRRRSDAAAYWIPEIQALHPGAGLWLARFAADTVPSIALSVLYYQSQLPRSRVEQLMSMMANAALRSPVASEVIDAPEDAQGSPRRTFAARSDEQDRSQTARRGSRREEILDSAVRLFRAQGYGGITIDDIGSAAGISGPAVYKHFRGKADVLSAALNRASEWLSGSASAAMTHSDASVAMGALIQSYIDATVGNPDLIAVYWLESRSLPDERAAEFQRAHRLYMDDWVSLVLRADERCSEAEARVIAYAITGLVNAYWTSFVEIPGPFGRRVLYDMATAALAAVVDPTEAQHAAR